MAQINQDLSKVEVDEGSGGRWAVWPAGDYRMMVTESEFKQTRAGDGQCLHLKLERLDGGGYLMDFLTLKHPKEIVETIAKAKLKELAIGSGHPDPNRVGDSEELHRKPVTVRIGVELAADEQYGDKDGNQNKVICYLPPGSPEAVAEPAKEQDLFRQPGPPHPDDIAF